jgi:hypothetical protein
MSQEFFIQIDSIIANYFIWHESDPTRFIDTGARQIKLVFGCSGSTAEDLIPGPGNLRRQNTIVMLEVTT